MTLSPKAARLVDWLISQFGSSRAKELWLQAKDSRMVTRELAQEILPLLERAEQWFSAYIESGWGSEDHRSDLANDISFMMAIESDLRREAA
jgi:hypothetical protein